MSIPAPPTSVSAPAPPISVSAPAPPVRTLAVASPFSQLAAVAEPVTFSMPTSTSPCASPPVWLAAPRSTLTPAEEAA
ncbi:hypothetical protein SLNSH_23980 [Alsobacter soli]|uniref:Uncharacterized protein n=1 Tax=Alsobacter soli TaxID=2109933 RepID=A0A2T1HLJ1_9HYPH|nr:hypothetical protein SLNSH_23980 [Alsobacter soli]